MRRSWPCGGPSRRWWRWCIERRATSARAGSANWRTPMAAHEKCPAANLSGVAQSPKKPNRGHAKISTRDKEWKWRPGKSVVLRMSLRAKGVDAQENGTGKKEGAQLSGKGPHPCWAIGPRGSTRVTDWASLLRDFSSSLRDGNVNALVLSQQLLHVHPDRLCKPPHHRQPGIARLVQELPGANPGHLRFAPHAFAQLLQRQAGSPERLAGAGQRLTANG